MPQKKDYLWNSLAGLINAAEAVILSMVITRTNGLLDAGIMTIAFAIGNLMMTVGKAGVRNYQVTDLDGTNSFMDYLTGRIATTAVMILACILYMIYCHRIKDYDGKKIAVILGICFIYGVESLEDVFWGDFQKRGRLYLGGMIFSIRWGLTLAGIIAVLIVKHDLVMAVGAGALITFLSEIILCAGSFHGFHEPYKKPNLHHVTGILWACAPLFIVAFMTFYITNAPKYAIDNYLSEEVQACYGFVSMPVFVIGLLNSFLYQPVMVHMATWWKEGRCELLRKNIYKQLGIIILITAVCLLGAYVVGIPVLSLLYGTSLTAYRGELLILLAGGGFLAVAGFMSVILTIMRKQKAMMYVYVMAAVIAFFSFNPVVNYGGVRGAAVCFDIIMLILAISFAGIALVMIKRKEEERG